MINIKLLLSGSSPYFLFCKEGQGHMVFVELPCIQANQNLSHDHKLANEQASW